MDKIYKCTVVVSFRVKDTHKEYEAHDGSIIGFKLPNGSIVRPIIGLEEENKDGGQDFSHESDFAKLGFEDLDYEVSDFEEWEEASEQLENDEYEDMPLENLPANLEPRFNSSKKIMERRLKEGK
jgi:hypothetical protein